MILYVESTIVGNRRFCGISISHFQILNSKSYMVHWMCRYIVHMVHRKEYMSFVDVSFLDWSWLAWLASNGIRGIYNGKEWKSYFISGLLFQWIIAKRGCFLDGLIAHSVSNFTIGCWVLTTDQRQYW